MISTLSIWFGITNFGYFFVCKSTCIHFYVIPLKPILSQSVHRLTFRQITFMKKQGEEYTKEIFHSVIMVLLVYK